MAPAAVLKTVGVREHPCGFDPHLLRFSIKGELGTGEPKGL